MISFEEALKIAKTQKSNIDYCTEYVDAYCFSAHEEDNMIGDLSCVVLKEDGKALSFDYYAWNYDGIKEDAIRVFDV